MNSRTFLIAAGLLILPASSVTAQARMALGIGDGPVAPQSGPRSASPGWTLPRAEARAGLPTDDGTGCPPPIALVCLEVRGGASFLLGDAGDGTGTGYVVAADLLRYFVPSLGVYAGYAYQRLPVEADGVDDVELELKGLEAGIRLQPRFRGVSGVGAWLSAGLTYFDYRVVGDTALLPSFGLGNSSFTIDGGSLGAQLRVGLEVPLGSLVSVGGSGLLGYQPNPDDPGPCPPPLQPFCGGSVTTLQAAAQLKIRIPGPAPR